MPLLAVAGSSRRASRAARARRARAREPRAVRALGLLALARHAGRGLRRPDPSVPRRPARRFTPQQSAYGSIYYVLLGAAPRPRRARPAARPLAARAARRAADALPARRARGRGLYWYVVTALSVVVVLTQLSPRCEAAALDESAVVRAPRRRRSPGRRSSSSATCSPRPAATGGARWGTRLVVTRRSRSRSPRRRRRSPPRLRRSRSTSRFARRRLRTRRRRRAAALLRRRRRSSATSSSSSRSSSSGVAAVVDHRVPARHEDRARCSRCSRSSLAGAASPASGPPAAESSPAQRRGRALRRELLELPRHRTGEGIPPPGARASATSTASGRRSRTSARWPPTSTSAPDTCRSPTPREQPSRSRVLFSDGRDPRARRLRRLARPRPADPAARTRRGAASPRAAALHRPLRRLPPDRSRAGGYVTGARVPPLDEADRRSRSPRRCGSGPYLMPRFSPEGDLGPAARLDRPLRRLRAAARTTGRLGDRPARPGPGGHGRVADRGGRARRLCLSLGRRRA